MPNQWTHDGRRGGLRRRSGTSPTCSSHSRRPTPTSAVVERAASTPSPTAPPASVVPCTRSGRPNPTGRAGAFHRAAGPDQGRAGREPAGGDGHGDGAVARRRDRGAGHADDGLAQRDRTGRLLAVDADAPLPLGRPTGALRLEINALPTN